MDAEIRDVLNLVSGGNGILLLGDLAVTPDGRSSLATLREEALATLKIPVTTQTPLNRVLQALYASSAEQADRLTASHLARTVDLSKDLVRVIQAPWERIYSVSGLSFSNVDFAGLNHPVMRHAASLPQPQTPSVTLLVDEAPQEGQSPRDFFAEVPQESERAMWQREMRAKILTAPTVAVAVESDSYLWDRLVCRDLHGTDHLADAPELPPCLLILSRIQPHDVLMSLTTGVAVVEGSLRDVADALSPGDMKLKQGHRLLARSRKRATEGIGVHQVTALVKDVELPAGWDFLRGYDPSWADVVYKRPVRLSMLKALRQACSFKPNDRNTVVLRTRAGAGKTTTLMMFAHDLTKQGHSVAWLDRSATHGAQQLLDEVDELDPDCVIVDDADIFGDRAPQVLRVLNKHGARLVVASVRTTRDRIIGSIPNSKYIDEAPLNDGELRVLHDVLSGAGLLGALQGVHPLATRLVRLGEICQRDLLAALIEIVTGQRFEERIQDEFSQLAARECEAYQTVALFIAYVGQARTLAEDVLLQCLAGQGPLSGAVMAVDSLLRQRLLVRDADGLRVRHRSIARALVDGLPRSEVARSLGGLLRHYAGRGHAIRDASDPQRRTMVAVLSHSLMVTLNLSVDDVRTLYGSVQRLLHDDFHYWLQRGAFETERGDEGLAASYLKSARACAGGANDPKVITESGILALRRARSAPHDVDAQKQARDAMQEMLDVTRKHGSSSPHTFRVLADEGAKFVDSCPTLANIERDELHASLDATVGIGLTVCQDNTLAMTALRAYARGRNDIVAVKAPLYPMPTVTAKPRPFPRRPRG